MEVRTNLPSLNISKQTESQIIEFESEESSLSGKEVESADVNDVQVEIKEEVQQPESEVEGPESVKDFEDKSDFE